MSTSAPDWIPIMQAADEWGIPPWKIEEECPIIWWKRRDLWLRVKHFQETGDESIFDEPEDGPEEEAG